MPAAGARPGWPRCPHNTNRGRWGRETGWALGCALRTLLLEGANGAQAHGHPQGLVEEYAGGLLCALSLPIQPLAPW